MPRRERSLAGVVRAAEEVLRQNRVDHVFVGAISVIVFGEPRTTRDVDIHVRIPQEKVSRVVREFHRSGFLQSNYDLRAASRALAHGTMYDHCGTVRLDRAWSADANAK